MKAQAAVCKNITVQATHMYISSIFKEKTLFKIDENISHSTSLKASKLPYA
jgi:hypothetical protein